MFVALLVCHIFLFKTGCKSCKQRVLH